MFHSTGLCYLFVHFFLIQYCTYYVINVKYRDFFSKQSFLVFYLSFTLKFAIRFLNFVNLVSTIYLLKICRRKQRNMKNNADVLYTYVGLLTNTHTLVLKRFIWCLVRYWTTFTENVLTLDT
jgi:hypothetical protein